MSYQLPIQDGSGGVCQTLWTHHIVMVSLKKTLGCHGNLKVRYVQQVQGGNEKLQKLFVVSMCDLNVMSILSCVRLVYNVQFVLN